MSSREDREKQKRDKILNRCLGVLFGQFVGDNLGATFEFQSPDRIGGIRNVPTNLIGGGPFQVAPGQPTDDGELALALFHSLVDQSTYSERRAADRYEEWLRSNPFDIGGTIRAGIQSWFKTRDVTCPEGNHQSQANGAMMRASPLAIFDILDTDPPSANFDIYSAMLWAMKDAWLTHPHPVCIVSNMFYVGFLRNLALGFGASVSFRRTEKLLDHCLTDSLRPARDTMMSEIEIVSDIEETGPGFSFNVPYDAGKTGWVILALQIALFSAFWVEERENNVESGQWQLGCSGNPPCGRSRWGYGHNGLHRWSCSRCLLGRVCFPARNDQKDHLLQRRGRRAQSPFCVLAQ